MRCSEIFILICLVFVSLLGNAQMLLPSQPPSVLNSLDSTIPTYTIPQQNNQELLQEDSILFGNSIYVFAKAIDVDIDFFGIARLDVLLDGGKVYRLKLRSNGANGINVIFDNFYLPDYTMLFAYDENDPHRLLGPFTNKSNNNITHTFSTAYIAHTEGMILEYYEPIPDSVPTIPLINIDKVGHEFKSDALPCNNNVNCDDRFLVQQLKRAVVRLEFIFEKNNDLFANLCSGTLMNQLTTENGLKFYVLSAAHCIENNIRYDISNAVFNYQDPGCIGSASPGTAHYSVSGMTQKSLRRGPLGPDFVLIELDNIPADFNYHFAGWDKDNESGLTYGIHHPSGDIKKISYAVSVGELALIPFIGATFYNGIIEGGSSGSGLFQHFEGRLIGTLSTGSYKCANDSTGQEILATTYGDFESQMDGSNDADKNLKTYLDPNGTGTANIDSRDPCFNDLVIEDRILRPANEYQMDNKVSIQAGNTLTSREITIIDGADYTFKAGTSVILEPGFSTDLGARFIAEISPCQQFSGGFKMNDVAFGTPQSILSDIAQQKSHKWNTEFLKVVPNPTGSLTQVLFNLTEETSISLYIYDAFGKLIKKSFYDLVGFGQHEIVFDASILQNGIYYINLRTSYNIMTTKIIVAK